VLTGHLIPSITSPTRTADFPHITDILKAFIKNNYDISYIKDIYMTEIDDNKEEEQVSLLIIIKILIY
jgi:hypothetical protein